MTTKRDQAPEVLMVTIERSPDVLPESAYLRARPPRYTLRTETHIARPVDEVFAFFSDANNLSVITPPDMGFVVLTPQPIVMAAGTIIDYRVRVTGVPIKWRTVIDAWEPGVRFVDSQERGPYACWWHEHRFSAVNGGCSMHDTVHYAPPFGVLGAIAQHVLIKRELRRIFNYRAQVITSRFGEATVPAR